MFERAIDDGQETDRVAFRTAKDGGRTVITVVVLVVLCSPKRQETGPCRI